MKNKHLFVFRYYLTTKKWHTGATYAKKFQKFQKKFSGKMVAATLVIWRVIWYNTGDMKRLLSGALTILCAGALCAGICAEGTAGQTAAADEGTGAAVTLTDEDLELLVPASYEQYLSLTEADSVSVAGGYIAAADGSDVYVYDGTAYRRYEHTAEVVQLELNAAHVLYFLDESGNLYTVDCTAEALTAEIYHNLSCSSFTLADDTVYYARSVTGRTNIYDERYPDDPVDQLSAAVTTVPSMAYANGRLYYTDGRYFNIRDVENDVALGPHVLESDVYDIAVAGSVLYYTDMENLYAYDIAADALRATYRTEGTNYGALCTDGGYLYVAGSTARGAKICRFDASREEFTDYEIGAASASANRLLSAKQSIVAGEYLVTADENRLQLYNYAEESFAAFSCDLTPLFLASNGETILVANESVACLYDFAGRKVSDDMTGFVGSVAGVAAAKGGDYFLVTENLSFYRIDAEDLTREGPVTKSNTSRASALCADIYGDLYVLYSDNTVCRYTAAEFMAASAAGATVHTFQSAVTDIAVDFDGNVYGLSDNTLLCSDGARYFLDAGDCVFGADAAPVDFAFGYETGTVYFVYDDYILSTEATGLPHLGALETGDAYRTLFEESADADDVVPVVTLDESAVLLEFALDGLTADAEYFPYLGYAREQAGVRALVLGEISVHGADYYMVTVFDPAARSYTAGLVLQTACTVIDESEYTSIPGNFTDGIGYLTNDVYLYKYPYLTERLAPTRLQKNTVVTVLRELSLGDVLMDYDYYFVSYSDGERTLYGYIPENFVRDFRGVTDGNDVVRYMTLHSGEDVTAVSADNRPITLEAGKDYAVAVYTTEDENTVLIAYETDGTTYYATVAADSFREGSSDGLRYFLVVLLLILDVILVVNYIVLRKKE